LTQPLLGIGRTLSRTALGVTLDLASATARLSEAAVDVITGRERSRAVLRVQVLILRDEHGLPLATEQALRPALARADQVLASQAGVRVRVSNIRTLEGIPPAAALDPRANRGLALDQLFGRVDYYRRHLRDPAGGTHASLIGAPITVVVFRHISGRTTGCSLGISANWVIVQGSLFDSSADHTYDETVLVHELGHALNLPHHRSRSNLMFGESSPPHLLRGTDLTRVQAGVINANRHVVPGR